MEKSDETDGSRMKEGEEDLRRIRAFIFRKLDENSNKTSPTPISHSSFPADGNLRCPHSMFYTKEETKSKSQKTLRSPSIHDAFDNTSIGLSKISFENLKANGQESRTTEEESREFYRNANPESNDDRAKFHSSKSSVSKDFTGLREEPSSESYLHDESEDDSKRLVNSTTHFHELKPSKALMNLLNSKMPNPGQSGKVMKLESVLKTEEKFELSLQKNVSVCKISDSSEGVNQNLSGHATHEVQRERFDNRFRYMPNRKVTNGCFPDSTLRSPPQKDPESRDESFSLEATTSDTEMGYETNSESKKGSQTRLGNDAELGGRKDPTQDDEVSKGKKIHPCKLCEKYFFSGRALGGHMRSHTVNSNFVKQSSAHEKHHNHSQFTRSYAFHKRKDEGGDEVSHGGNAVMSNDKLLQPHLSRCFSCKICSRVFESGRALGGHMRTHRTYTLNSYKPSVEESVIEAGMQAEENAPVNRKAVGFTDHFNEELCANSKQNDSSNNDRVVPNASTAGMDSEDEKMDEMREYACSLDEKRNEDCLVLLSDTGTSDGCLLGKEKKTRDDCEKRNRMELLKNQSRFPNTENIKDESCARSLSSSLPSLLPDANSVECVSNHRKSKPPPVCDDCSRSVNCVSHDENVCVMSEPGMESPIQSTKTFFPSIRPHPLAEKGIPRNGKLQSSLESGHAIDGGRRFGNCDCFSVYKDQGSTRNSDGEEDDETYKHSEMNESSLTLSLSLSSAYKSREKYSATNPPSMNEENEEVKEREKPRERKTGKVKLEASRTSMLSPSSSPVSPEPKNHVCSVCEMRFPTGQALGGHKRRHWYNSMERKCDGMEKNFRMWNGQHITDNDNLSLMFELQSPLDHYESPWLKREINLPIMSSTVLKTSNPSDDENQGENQQKTKSESGGTHDADKDVKDEISKSELETVEIKEHPAHWKQKIDIPTADLVFQNQMMTTQHSTSLSGASSFAFPNPKTFNVPISGYAYHFHALDSRVSVPQLGIPPLQHHPLQLYPVKEHPDSILTHPSNMIYPPYAQQPTHNHPGSPNHPVSSVSGKFPSPIHPQIRSFLPSRVLSSLGITEPENSKSPNYVLDRQPRAQSNGHSTGCKKTPLTTNADTDSFLTMRKSNARDSQ